LKFDYIFFKRHYIHSIGRILTANLSRTRKKSYSSDAKNFFTWLYIYLSCA